MEFSKLAIMIQFLLSVVLILVVLAAFLLGKDVSQLGMLSTVSCVMDGTALSFYLWKAKTENRAKYAELFALKAAEKYGIEAALQMTEIVLKE